MFKVNEDPVEPYRGAYFRVDRASGVGKNAEQRKSGACPEERILLRCRGHGCPFVEAGRNLFGTGCVELEQRQSAVDQESCAGHGTGVRGTEEGNPRSNFLWFLQLTQRNPAV